MSTTTTARPSTASATIRIHAPIEQVWAVIADPTRMGELSPENVSADVPTPLAVGVTFTGHNDRGGTAWSVPCEVLEYSAPTTFRFHAGDDEVGTTWQYALRDRGEATEVTASFDSRRLRHPDWIDRLEGRHAQLVEDMHTTLENLRHVVEGNR